MGSGKLPADGTNSPKRLYYIDILNILSCFTVVVLHCSGGVFYYQKTRLWFIYMFLQTVAHFAVPVFFMITGANLLDYRKNTIQRRSLKNVPQEHLHRFFLVAALLGTPVCVKTGNRAHERKGAFPCDIQ